MWEKIKIALTYLGGIVLLLVLGFLIALAGQLWLSPGWVEVKTLSKDVTLKFPIAPDKTWQAAPFPWNGATMKTLKASSGVITYQMDEIDTNSTGNNSEISLESLTQLLNTTVVSVHGNLEATSKPDDFLIKLGDGSIIRGRIFGWQNRGRVFRLMVSKAQGSSDSSEINYFLNSFQNKN